MNLSIITINYNNLAGLRRTFLSVFAQSSQEFEYIVIDGGSTDGSKELIEQHANRIGYWISEPDAGIYHAMNKGIAVAKGKYLYFLNSGDWLNKDTVLDDIQHFFDCSYDILYGDLEVHTGLGQTQVWRSDKELTLDHFCYDTIPHQASFIRRDLFFAKEQFGYYEHLKISSDWAFFFEKIIIENVTVKYLHQVIASYNMDGISAKEENRLVIADERRSIIDQYFPGYYDLMTKYRSLLIERDLYKRLLSSKVIRFYLRLRGVKY